MPFEQLNKALADYTRGAEDVFAVETDVATQIAQAMEARLTEREQAAIGRPPTASAEANGLYMVSSQTHHVSELRAWGGGAALIQLRSRRRTRTTA